MRRDAFLRHRHALQATAIEAALADGPGDAEHRLPHNVIDRQRGTVRDEAGLYFQDEHWPKPAERRRDLYLATTLPIDTVLDLLRAVGTWGHGRDSTYGRGRFRILGHEPERVFFAHRGTRFLSLSHGCWTEALRAPRYKLATHFGKLAIEAGMACGRPWKRPILLMKPGATFAAEGPGPFGAWLEGIVHSEVPGELRYTPGHHAFHLAVPYTEAPDAG